jgi:hypothetical protein
MDKIGAFRQSRRQIRNCTVPHEPVFGEAAMRLFVIPLVALGVLAGGYSDEPNEGQMKRAFEDSLTTLVHNVMEFVTENNGPEAAQAVREAGSDRFAVRSFRKLDCLRTPGESAYLCEFAVDIELMNGDLHRRMSGRFFASPQGLAFADEV